MTYFFDSSWLVAALIEDEPNHEICLSKLEQALATNSAVAARHSLAEVFHTITGKKGVPPEQAAELLQQNFAAVRWLELAEEDYWSCIKSAHLIGVRGGAIFDFLLLRVAERTDATRVYTLNKAHFLLFGGQMTHKICGPDD